jgi:hypothetical protein
MQQQQQAMQQQQQAMLQQQQAMLQQLVVIMAKIDNLNTVRQIHRDDAHFGQK